MKKFSRLFSLLVVMALIVCMIPVMAMAEETSNLWLDMTEFNGWVGVGVESCANLYTGEFNSAVTWTTSDPAVATVEPYGEYFQYGQIQLVGEGTATITATYGTDTATCTITATAIPALTLDTPEEITCEGWYAVMMSFTPTVSGWYSIYVEETDDRISGSVEGGNLYGDFYTDSEGVIAFAGELEAGAPYIIHAYVGQESAATFKLVVTESPERTGYKMSRESVEMTAFEGSSAAYVQVLPVPATAAIKEAITWKIADETVAAIDYAGGAHCYLIPVAPGSTTLEAYDAQNNLIGSVPVTVYAVEDMAQELVWGVEYDLTGDENRYFIYSPAVTDTYTFESTGSSDPYVRIYEITPDGYSHLYGFDDSYVDPDNGYNFREQYQLEQGKRYLFEVGNYETGDYGFSVVGTAASDPGYDPVKVAAKPASCTEDGNIAYYKCSITGILFANAEGTKLAGEVVIPATGHKLQKVAEVAATAEKEGTKAHEKCSECGALVVDGKEVKAADLVIPKLGTGDNAPTGDSTMVLPLIALVVLSALGLGVTVVMRKRSN